MQDYDGFRHNKELTVIVAYEDKTVYLRRLKEDEEVIEYKAKGDNKVPEKECTKCHEKRSKKAIYCQICGSKLVEKSKFKVGDYVTISLLGVNLTAILEKTVEENWKLWGCWYNFKKAELYYTFWYSNPQNYRLAIPEEIAEYESALNFHKHGRKPFKVKEGDILSNREIGKFFVDYADIEIGLWEKEDFTSGDYTLLKTAEEVNEWLNK